MILATQDQVLRSIRDELISATGLPSSRVYLTADPVFTEAMDFAIQVSPIASGATNEFNRSGLGFVTERFAVTTFVRSVSDNTNKQDRQLAGIDRGVIARQSLIRKALIQNNLSGLLQVDIRFVSSGPVRIEPRSEAYLSATDIFVCSYAIPWPVAGQFRFGWDDGTPNWTDLSAGEIHYDGKINLSVTASANPMGPAPIYLWFAFPSDLHSLGITLRTPAGIEPFYRTGFLPPSGPSVGTLVEDGVTYQLYRRAYPTTASSLTYTVIAP
jgi:hypothetical protein